MKKILLTVIALPCLAFGYEWKFPQGGDPALRVPRAPEWTKFDDGLKLTAEFEVDLSKVKAPANHANIITYGSDYDRGFSMMVTKDGRLLVCVKGTEDATYRHALEEFDLPGKVYRLEAWLLPNCVRFRLDGKEVGSFVFKGKPDLKKVNCLCIGSMNGYKFYGNLRYAALEPIEVETLPPGPAPTSKVNPMPPLRQARAEIKWSRVIASDRDRYVGWPTVTRLKNGDLIAVCSGDRFAHVCPWGKVQMTRSTDGGETWTKLETIQSGVMDDRDAGIVQLPDGDLLLTWFTSDYYQRSFKDHPDWQRHYEKIPANERKPAIGYFRALSKDNGKTWTKPMRMAGLGHAPHGPKVLKNGMLGQFGIRSGVRHPRPDGTSETGSTVAFYVSADKGATWKMLCGEVPCPNDEGFKGLRYDEPDFVELDDGTLVGHIRFNGSDQHIRQSISKDGGKTWSVAEKLAVVGLPPFLIKTADGKLVTVYGRRRYSIGIGEFACISDDGGKTWDVANEVALRYGHSPDLGYPSSVQLPDGDILTVYYQAPSPEEPCRLMATKWHLAR